MNVWYYVRLSTYFAKKQKKMLSSRRRSDESARIVCRSPPCYAISTNPITVTVIIIIIIIIILGYSHTLFHIHTGSWYRFFFSTRSPLSQSLLQACLQQFLPFHIHWCLYCAQAAGCLLCSDPVQHYIVAKERVEKKNYCEYTRTLFVCVCVECSKIHF